jgi:transposase-like protein
MVTKRKFPPEFKRSIVQALETKSMAEICRAHNLASSTVCGWRDSFETNPKEAFKGHGRLWKPEAKVAQLERTLGELYAENALLKKAYEQLKQLHAEERYKRRNAK